MKSSLLLLAACVILRQYVQTQRTTGDSRVTQTNTEVVKPTEFRETIRVDGNDLITTVETTTETGNYEMSTDETTTKTVNSDKQNNALHGLAEKNTSVANLIEENKSENITEKTLTENEKTNTGNLLDDKTNNRKVDIEDMNVNDNYIKVEGQSYAGETKTDNDQYFNTGDKNDGKTNDDYVNDEIYDKMNTEIIDTKPDAEYDTESENKDVENEAETADDAVKDEADNADEENYNKNVDYDPDTDNKDAENDEDDDRNNAETFNEDKNGPELDKTDLEYDGDHKIDDNYVTEDKEELDNAKDEADIRNEKDNLQENNDPEMDEESDDNLEDDAGDQAGYNDDRKISDKESVDTNDDIAGNSAEPGDDIINNADTPTDNQDDDEMDSLDVKEDTKTEEGVDRSSVEIEYMDDEAIARVGQLQYLNDGIMNSEEIDTIDAIGAVIAMAGVYKHADHTDNRTKRKKKIGKKNKNMKNVKGGRRKSADGDRKRNAKRRVRNRTRDRNVDMLSRRRNNKRNGGRNIDHRHCRDRNRKDRNGSSRRSSHQNESSTLPKKCIIDCLRATQKHIPKPYTPKTYIPKPCTPKPYAPKSDNCKHGRINFIRELYTAMMKNADSSKTDRVQPRRYLQREPDEHQMSSHGGQHRSPAQTHIGQRNPVNQLSHVNPQFLRPTDKTTQNQYSHLPNRKAFRRFPGLGWFL